MNALILILSIIASAIGLFVAIQTISETREKYYKDYLKRKKNEKT